MCICFLLKETTFWKTRQSEKNIIIPRSRSSAGLENFLFFLIQLLRSHDIKTRNFHLLKARLLTAFFVRPHILELMCDFYCANKKYFWKTRRAIIWFTEWNGFFVCLLWFLKIFFDYCFATSFMQTLRYSNWLWERLIPQVMMMPTFRS